MITDDRRDAHVRPPGWQNPTPASEYDLAIVGGGTAGLVCAAGAAGLGARVALIERERLGGDCLNVGCVPSKALLAAAAMGRDFSSAMAHLRDARVALAPNDSARRMASLGVDVFFGEAAFASPRTLAVRASSPRILHYRRAVIATGSAPSIPQIDGLSDCACLTNETIFDLSTQPRRLVILGGGPVGCELAQAFARLGTKVTLVERAPHLLPREDADAGLLISAALSGDGVRVITSATVSSVTRAADGGVSAQLADQAVAADALLVATGRTPRIDGLGLERAGVAVGAQGIAVDDRLRTSNPRVFAAGDVSGGLQFTHAADAMARIVVQNALFYGRKRRSDVIIPWCTFTSPEVAHVGVTSAEAGRRGASTITVDREAVDRAVIAGDTAGFVRVHHDRGRVLGATIVAPHAGELIAIVAMLMQQKGSLGDLSSAVFPYPTEALALKRAGDMYQRQRLTPLVQRALRYYFRRM